MLGRVDLATTPRARTSSIVLTPYCPTTYTAVPPRMRCTAEPPGHEPHVRTGPNGVRTVCPGYQQRAGLARVFVPSRHNSPAGSRPDGLIGQGRRWDRQGTRSEARIDPCPCQRL